MERIADPVLVTGATGFIGRRLVAHLIERGCAVRALALPGERTEGLWPAPVEVVRGDVSDAPAVAAAVRGAATVFHLAAVVGDWGDEALFQRVTVGGTRHVLDAAADAGARAVLASSVVFYGDAIGREVCHEDHPSGRPLGPYSRSKQAQERIADELVRARGLRITIVRPTNVYGPGSRPWVHDAAAQLRSGMPSLVGGGRMNAALCHVDNLADLLARAGAAEGAIGRVYNASDGSAVTWARYFGDLAAALGAPPPRSIPRAAAAAAATACEAAWRWLRIRRRPPLTHEALNLVGSDFRVPIDRARRELGYEPRVAYDQGIAGVVEYVRSTGL